MGWNRMLDLGRTVGAGLFVALALVGGSAPSAFAQSADATAVWIDNSELRAIVYVSDQENSVDATGRFAVIDHKTRTNPNTTDVVDSAILNLPHTDDLGTAVSSYLTVRVDGGTIGGGATPTVSDFIWGTDGAGNDAAWIEPPRVIGNSIRARWQTPPGETDAPIPPIEVDLNLTLIHDMVRYEFTVINRDSRAHTVGLRFVQDYGLAGASRKGPVYTPNIGQITTERTLVGSQVPSSWRVFDDQQLNTAGGVLVPPHAAANFIAPDTLIFGNAAGLVTPLWTFQPSTDPTFDFVKNPWDVVAGLYWSPQLVAPGQSKVFVTYFGRQHATTDFERPFAAGVDGPFSLTLNNADPANPVLQPNPFAVTAFVRNLLDVPLSNVSATITLPTGLTLAAGQTPTMTQSTIAVGAEAAFGWNVVPDGTTSGRLAYSVSFNASPGSAGKVVTREIDIPALPTHPFLAGLQMVSFPFTFDDPSPSVALGLDSFDFDLVRWNSTVGAYQVVDRIEPGFGYWLRLAGGKTVNLHGSHPVSTAAPFEIKLLNDWNQIGNPFVLPVRWADVMVLNLSLPSSDPLYGQAVTVAQAAQNGWIYPAVFWWDSAVQDYRWDQDLSLELTPFTGYWVRALAPNISLLVPAPTGGTGRSARITRAAVPQAAGDWKVRLWATDGQTRDTYNFIGMSAAATDGINRLTVEKPPAARDAVRLQIVRNEAGRSLSLAQDIRAANRSRKQWNVVVTSPKPGTDVTVSWPDISAVPRGYELYITDPASGTRRAMRQASSLRVNTGANATRSLTVTVEPRVPGAFRITGLAVTPSRSRSSASIAFTTSQQAEVTVRILSATGRAVRTVLTRAASSGTTSVNWDYRDAKGGSVPAGLYQVEVRGSTPDGEASRVAVPYVIPR